MLSIVVLGTAAGGGVPQWNCGCAQCGAARYGRPELRATQASIAISADREHWFLINASPDLRQQITDTPQLHPRPGMLRDSPIAGVILTNGEVDAVAGLLSLREGWPFYLYAHHRVLDILGANSIFNVVNPDLVPRQPLELETPFEPRLPGSAPSGLEITAFAAPGKTALYLEGVNGGEAGDTLGLDIRDKAGGHRLVFLAACAEVTPEVAARLEDADLVFFDGTLWRDDEMIALGLGKKTGRRMGHMSMTGEAGSIRALRGINLGRKLFLHINNSNPTLQPGAPERRSAEAAGWEFPRDGMEVTL